MIIAIGDLQGCAHSLLELIESIDDDRGAHAQWWFCGDLVNRGPDSLATLRAIRALGERAVTVLGNHDLHLLGVAAQARTLGQQDTLDDILSAPDRDELIDWLRHRPLAHHAHGHLLVHAGVLPQWNLKQTLEYAEEIESELRADSWQDFLVALFAGRSPLQWDTTLSGTDRARIIVNAFTRLRLCDRHGRMELKNTNAPDHAPAGLMPWFDVPGRRTAGTPIVFGHWSTLGLKLTDDLIGLDTGCVWGGKLSAVQLTPAQSPRPVWQIDCPMAQQPGD